jgi:hypothetical protein
MDVVYNHTTDEEVFRDITPDYYLSNDITGRAILEPPYDSKLLFALSDAGNPVNGNFLHVKSERCGRTKYHGDSLGSANPYSAGPRDCIPASP